MRSRISILLGLLLALLPAGVIFAHANLIRSEPAAGARLDQPPSEIRLWFSEPIEPAYTQVRLLDSSGQALSTGNLRVLPGDGTVVAVAVTSPLGQGIYTVAWRTMSRVDGHITEGSFSFGVGVVPPRTGTVAGAAGNPLEALIRAAVFILAAWLVGGALFWLFVYRADWPETLTLGVALGLQLAVLFWTLAWGLAAGGAGRLFDTVFNTQLGRVFIARNVFALGLVLATLWGPAARLGIGLGLLGTVSLGSHATATADPLAVFIDWAHLAGAAAWAGGLMRLVALAWSGRGQKIDWGGVVGRFSNLAMVSVVLIGLTGLYRAWQELGEPSALVDTVWGRLLLAKTATAGLALLLGGFHLLRWRLGPGGSPGTVRFSLAAEAVLLASALVVSGPLTFNPPARSESLERPVRLEGQAGEWGYELEIRPGRVGDNEVVVRVGPPTPDARVRAVFVRFRMTDHEMGEVEVIPDPTGPNEFAAQTYLLSMVGNWEARVIIRPEGDYDRTGRAAFRLREPALAAAPGPPVPPWMLGTVGLWAAGLLIITTSLLTQKSGTERRAMAGLLLILAGSVVFFYFANRSEAGLPGLGKQVPVVNPVPADEASLARGQTLYQTYCISCHGPQGRGDGPNAPSLPVPPADLALHAPAHTDGELFRFIANGFQGTPMPAFKGTLSDEDIWHLVNYIKTFARYETSYAPNRPGN
jgi:copper transport protein